MNKEFLTARYDRCFKEIMLNKNNTDILLSVLRSILPNIPDGKIIEKNIELNQGNLKVKRKNLDILLSIGKLLLNIEVNNQESFEYIRIRNFAFFCNLYASHVKVGNEYKSDKEVIQINFTYGLPNNKKKKIINNYYDKNGFVDNIKIVEIDMDKVMDIWYSKDEKMIEKYKYLIMLDLYPKDLKELSKKDRVVKKYMDNVIEINRNIDIPEYMTEEEEQTLKRNILLSIGREEGIEQGEEKKQKSIINKLLGKGKTKEEISYLLDIDIKDIEKYTK